MSVIPSYLRIEILAKPTSQDTRGDKELKRPLNYIYFSFANSEETNLSYTKQNMSTKELIYNLLELNREPLSNNSWQILSKIYIILPVARSNQVVLLCYSNC